MEDKILCKVKKTLLQEFRATLTFHKLEMALNVSIPSKYDYWKMREPVVSHVKVVSCNLMHVVPLQSEVNAKHITCSFQKRFCN